MHPRYVLRKINFTLTVPLSTQVYKWEAANCLRWKYGIPENLLKMVKLFYDGFQCSVGEQGEIGEWFDVTTGVKQGCNMSWCLFLFVLDWVMRRTVGDGNNGIRWKFTLKLDDLDLADDIVLLSSTR